HRLLRRGMPYGPYLPEGAEEDGVPRGLYFVAYNASIERQFEFVQQRWVNAPTGTGLDDDFDPLLCRRSASMVIPAAGEGGLPRVIDGLRGFVDFLGGGYFFVPGLSALRTLATEVTS
ncbi:MAG TPA: peroxidase, partial [Polyangiales bacterium]